MGSHIEYRQKRRNNFFHRVGKIICQNMGKSTCHFHSPGMMLHPFNRRIRRHILKGDIGRLCWAATGASGVGDYHMNEEFRTGDNILTDVDPSWYYRKPGGGPQYDVTVYCLHNLTGILGPAKRVTAMSGMVIPERDYHGKKIICDMDDTTFITVDFGSALFAFVYAAAKGGLTQGFSPTFFGTKGSIIGTKLGETDLKKDGEYSPHVNPAHSAKAESHVFEDMMQLVRWVREDKPSIATAEHARHVIDIIESGYKSAETGRAVDLSTSFNPLDPENKEV
jgi:predicted dehydrogenase